MRKKQESGGSAKRNQPRDMEYWVEKKRKGGGREFQIDTSKGH